MSWLPLSFSRPDLLALLALAPALYAIGRRSLVDLSPSRRWAALALRAAIVALLVLALAGARWVRFSGKMCVLFLLDGSTSVRADVNKEALESVGASLKKMTSKDWAGVVAFGEDAMVDLPPSQKPVFEGVNVIPSRGRTDLSRALRLAAGLFPSDAEKRVVLFTDGNENAGRAEREGQMAAANGMRVDVVPLEGPRQGDVAVERVAVPEREDVDRPFDVKVTVRASAPGPARLWLFRDGAVMGEPRDVQLNEGKNIFTFQGVEKEAGFHTYEAQAVSPLDSVQDNNRAAAFCHVAGKPRVLLVGQEADTRLLADALSADKIPVSVDRVPPRTVAQAQNFDAIILANVPGVDLSEEQMKILYLYVSDLGGGLGMIGGEDSFGVGGYGSTPVEEALPVKMELKDKRNFPSLAMMMLIDKSGSMEMGVQGGVSKVKLACAAAARAIELMTDRDRVGVIAFDSAAKWVQEMTDAKQKKAIIDTVFSIRAGGGTDMYPGLHIATAALIAEQAQVKHIIALTDGMTAPNDWDKIIAAMSANNITLSTVAVGPDADKRLLAELAGKGGGRFYATEDPRNTPVIFAKETILVQRSYLIEKEFTPAVETGNEILKGIASMPPLKGYVATEAKPGAEKILRSTLSGHDEPILAVWRHGLGKALAFTSDAKNRWAAQWIGWEGFNKFWPQAVRWLMRGQRQGALHPRVAIEGDRGRITVDAVAEDDERFLNFLDLSATVITPDFKTLQLPLRQTGPGRYEASFHASGAGAYIATVAGGAQPPATAGYIVSYPEELRDLKPNYALLSRLAEETGGRINSPPGEWFRHTGAGIRCEQDIWYPLVLLALFLVPFDVAVRRVRLSPEQWAAVRAYAAMLIPFVRFRQHAGAEARLADLMRRKQAVKSSLAAEQTSAEPPTEPGGARSGFSGAQPPIGAVVQEPTSTGKEGRRKQAPVAAPESKSESKPLFIRGDVAERLSQDASAEREPPKPDKPVETAPRAASSLTGRLLAARKRARKE